MTLPFDLAPASAETVTVTFTPTVEGAQSANITITHNAAGSPTVVAVTGTGTVVAAVPTIVISAPTADQAFPAGTVSTPITVAITDHAAPGHWHWLLDTPFPTTGVAGGFEVLTGNTATISPLADGEAHTVYVTLVSGDGSDAVIEPNVTAQAAFTIQSPGATQATVTVPDSMGRAAGVVTIPIGVSDLAGAGVIGIALDVSYDATLLTPANDGVNTTAAAFGDVFGDVGLWSIEQNVPTPGLLRIALAGDANAGPSVPGVLASVTFDIAATAAEGATSLIALTKAEFNEGGVPSTTAGGTFSVLTLMYGDVTGNGEVTPYDAGWVLEHVANELAAAPHVPFPIEVTAPTWAPFPVTHDVAHEVANVDGDVDPTDGTHVVAAMDAALILQRSVQLITVFPVETPAAAPVQAPFVALYDLDVRASSERPGARVTVRLDASAAADLHAGELVLDYDAGLLRPVDVAFRGAGTGALLSHREGDGRLAAAFASGRAIEGADAILEVTFEATRNVSRPVESAIRASHLRLNGAKVETGFAHTFRVEPFQTRLMANYPNPFNPETWIPFELAEAADVTIRVYGVDGRLVRTLELGRRDVGEYAGRDEAAYWDGANASGEAVASGVYIYELTAGDYRAVRRMVVRK